MKKSGEKEGGTGRKRQRGKEKEEKGERDGRREKK